MQWQYMPPHSDGNRFLIITFDDEVYTLNGDGGITEATYDMVI